MIYEPEEDSLMIKKHIKDYVKKDANVLDMGTGSAILAAEAAKFTKNVLAVDINPEAESYAKKHKIRFIQSNLFQNIKEKFDLILFNPPYLPEMEGEPEEVRMFTSGGKQGHELLEEFLKQAKQHLNKSAKMLIICSTLTGNVELLFKKHNYKFKLIDKEDAFFEKILLYEVQNT